MTANPDTSQILYYLHGQIVEGSDGRPRSDAHGFYEYEEIVETFSIMGFDVQSEVRPKHTRVADYAKKIAAEIEQRIQSGVPEQHITVVGASKGGMIAATVSHLLKRPHIRFIILAGLFPSLYESDGITLSGEVLSIHDSADNFAISPDLFFDNSPLLTRKKSIITKTGLGHGLLYKPYPIWVDELMQFCGLESDTIEETLKKHRGSRY
ncbi:MAG: hypothetical protein JXX29_06890 [Deltaproteobacteria bacterium]|nr:hypothetical protein [Deltaproteobacteria bacterium]MBN2671379.1 hypothetical protein [Deltaproteobacteria bacterium]